MKPFFHISLIFCLLNSVVYAKDNNETIYQQAALAYQKQDFVSAFRLLFPLAQKGDKTAQHNLAVLYQDGLGVEANAKLALYWYEQAAKQGEAEAQFMAGLMYSQGEGSNQNYTKAVYWYEKAAAQGHHEAMNNLAARYATGTGVKQDMNKAKMWYKKAAQAGNIHATTMLKQLENIK